MYRRATHYCDGDSVQTARVLYSTIVLLSTTEKVKPNNNLDEAISNYSKIASLPEPKESERSRLHEWIYDPDSGGCCRFLGLDLGGFEQPSAYDAVYQNDLAIFSNSHGEDDLFTKFIQGPALRWFHLLWRYKAVSCFVLSDIVFFNHKALQTFCHAC